MLTPKRKPNVSVSDVEIMNAIEAVGGDYVSAANKLRISVKTIYLRARKNPEIKEFRLSIIGDLIEIAENNVYNKLLEGDFSASKFVLERLAREKWGPQQAQAPQAVWPEPIGGGIDGP